MKKFTWKLHGFWMSAKQEDPAEMRLLPLLNRPPLFGAA
jgi:hypothetical protein